jgi:hypothetical protein
MSSHWDDEQTGAEDPSSCDICGRHCEAEENAWGEQRIDLQICTLCGKKFCSFCVYRIGGKEYCSRPCGSRYFFGGDDDDESPDE